MKRLNIKFKHSGIENVIVLGLILSFFVILTPLVYTQLPAQGAGPKYDIVTGLAVSNTMEADITIAILIALAVAFLIPVELLLRKQNTKKRRKR